MSGAAAAVLRAFALVAFAACELTPAPAPTKIAVAPAPAPAVAPAPAPIAVEPPVAPGSAGEITDPILHHTDTAPPIVPTQPCLDTGVHLAELMIAADHTLDSHRAMLVRKQADTCSRNHWSDAARACFDAAHDAPSMQACEHLLGGPR